MFWNLTKSKLVDIIFEKDKTSYLNQSGTIVELFEIPKMYVTIFKKLGSVQVCSSPKWAIYVTASVKKYIN